MPNKALISDFDGTISKTDFFYHALDKCIKKEALCSWRDYQNGKISHVEALRRIYSNFELEKDEFDKFALELEIEDGFQETVEHCKTKGIDVYIASAGADYYINLILKNMNLLDKVTVISNKSVYSKVQGLNILACNSDDPFYSADYGVCKGTVIKKLKEKYDYLIFAGDGHPDFEAAKIADTVFARGVLLELCRKAGIKTMEFNSYQDILRFLQRN